MNSELFTFSILAAILGMAVVFLFLGILSFLMSAIKAIFGERPARERSTVASQQQGAAAEPADSEADWVIAAAAAYLIDEELDARRSAAAWKPRVQQAADAWLTMPRV